VDAVAGTLSAHLSLVTRLLSPFYHTDPGFTVAPGARVRVMKNGWPVKATLADVVVGDRVSRPWRGRPQRPGGPGAHDPLDDGAARSRAMTDVP